MKLALGDTHRVRFTPTWPEFNYLDGAHPLRDDR